MGEAERFQIVRPLGADATGFVAHDSSVKPPRLVVLARATRGASTPEERSHIVKRCRGLVGLAHPKVVPIREVLERDGEVLVVCDFVDGEWLSALMAVDPRPPVEVLLRIVLDVLEGLAALHDLRDERGQGLKIVHGALSPECVLVADDGVAEIARPFGVSPQKPDRFVAPELRRGEAPSDIRADVYSAGAMLREVLGSASADAKWAEQLTDIAWRACSVDPENRWPSAASMATTLRRIAGSKLASSDDVASFLRRYFGARIAARRSALDLHDEQGPPSSGEPISVRPSDMMVIDPPSAPTLVGSVPPPVPHARAAVAKVTLVKKSFELVELPEPAVERPVGTVTHKGMAAIAPPMHMIEAPLAKKVVSLPPPDIIVPDIITPIGQASPSAPPVARAASASKPPPDESSDAYRRRMPTFPILEPPPRRSTAVQAMAIAAAMVTTFGVGWWLGRNYPPPPDAPQAVCPSLPAAPVAQLPPPPAVVAPVATPTATPVPSTAAASSVAAATSSPGSATAAVASTVAAAPRPTGPVWTSPSPAPKPVVPAPMASAVEPKPTAETKPPPPPRPTGSAGYVPSEL
jgi:hypothetical protein